VLLDLKFRALFFPDALCSRDTMDLEIFANGNRIRTVTCALLNELCFVVVYGGRGRLQVSLPYIPKFLNLRGRDVLSDKVYKEN